MKIGIVGLPNVGKSTLFNALTKADVLVANYPFATIDPSVGIVTVPDERLDRLSALLEVREDHPCGRRVRRHRRARAGRFGRRRARQQFLSHIREVDAILEMVRFFEDLDITHVHGSVDPVRDIEIINLELVLADAQSVKNRREKLVRDVKMNKKEALEEDAILAKLEAALSDGKLGRAAGLSPEELFRIKSLNLLTLKPILYSLNGKSGSTVEDERREKAHALIESLARSTCTWTRIRSSSSTTWRATSRRASGRSSASRCMALTELIRGAYATLGLITFFTTGPKETRAWTIPAGASAPEAGAAIHTDFKDKFIRAEVINCQKLLDDGSWSAAPRQRRHPHGREDVRIPGRRRGGLLA